MIRPEKIPEISRKKKLEKRTHNAKTNPERLIPEGIKQTEQTIRPL
jgi:hypothetical protein